MEDTNQGQEGKKISIHHFVYFFVIFIIIIIGILSLEFGGSGRAGENLNFGATLASIILAVIAILYTMFEGATQRSTSKAISKSVRNLKQTSEEFMNLTGDIKGQYNEMQKFNEELLQKIIDNDEWRKSVMNEIQAKAAKGTEGNPPTIDLTTVEQIFDKSKDNINLNILNDLVDIFTRDKSKELRLSGIMSEMGSKDYHVSFITLRRHVMKLVSDDLVIRQRNDEGASIYRWNPDWKPSE